MRILFILVIKFTICTTLLAQEKPANGLIAIGEAHFIKGTRQVQLQIIKKHIKGHRYIILEAGVSSEIILNEYMKTGDQSLLKNIYPSYDIESIFFFQYIRKNMQHIRFIGIDYEKSLSIKFLFKKWSKNIKNSELRNKFLEIINLSNKSFYRYFENKISVLKGKKYSNLIKNELKENYSNFVRILKNPVFHVNHNNFIKRDSKIIVNLVKIPRKKLERSFLIYGNNHLIRKNYMWSQLLNHYNGKLSYSLYLLGYNNCLSLRNNQPYNSTNLISKFIYKKEIDKKAETKFTRVKKENSLTINSPFTFVLLSNF